MEKTLMLGKIEGRRGARPVQDHSVLMGNQADLSVTIAEISMMLAK